MRKIVKTGYGLGLLSLAEAKKIASKVKKDLKLNDKESMVLAKELVANSKTASKEILSTANRYFESALVKSGAASKGELKTAKKILRKRAHKVKDQVKDRLRNLHRRKK